MTGHRPQPDRLGGAERRLAALEAELGEVQAGKAPLTHPPADPEASRLRQVPRSTWWLVAGVVLVVAAIVTAAV